MMTRHTSTYVVVPMLFYNAGWLSRAQLAVAANALYTCSVIGYGEGSDYQMAD